MALPLKPGLTPSEVSFLCEMELVNIVPEERLAGLDLLGGTIQPFNPPFTTRVPLWLALLLHRQRKARLVPPIWLSPSSLSEILDRELNESGEAFSDPPNLPRLSSNDDDLVPAVYGQSTSLGSSTSSSAAVEYTPPFTGDGALDRYNDRLPYHWLELAHLYLVYAADNLSEPDTVARLIRDLREARIAKIRRGTAVLGPGAGFKMNGVGAMEVAESKAFVTGVIDGLRCVTASRELNAAEANGGREGENAGAGGYESDGQEDDDDDDNAL